MCGREDFDHAIMDDFAFDDDNEREEDTKPKAEKRAGQPRRRPKTNRTGRGIPIGTLEEAEESLLEVGHKAMLLLFFFFFFFFFFFHFALSWGGEGRRRRGLSEPFPL